METLIKRRLTNLQTDRSADEIGLCVGANSNLCKKNMRHAQ